MTTPLWKPQLNKLHAYEGLHTLNRCFQAALLSLERLEDLGMFRLEYLNAYKVMLEHVRAQANDELMSTLQEHEQEEAYRFDQMQREWEKQYLDPDDVFFAVQNRKREIKEQIRKLQDGLKRQKPRKGRSGARR